MVAENPDFRNQGNPPEDGVFHHRHFAIMSIPGGIIHSYKAAGESTMLDTYTLRFQNFRSLRDVEVEVAPLTVVYGPNGSGKSSLLYGLLTLKNFLTNPSQNLPSLFSYPSISLGGWSEVVHRHRINEEMSLSFGVGSSRFPSPEFTLAVKQSGGQTSVAFDHPVRGISGKWPSKLDLEIPFPYGGNRQVEDYFELEVAPTALGTREGELPSKFDGELTWNGLTLAASFRNAPASHVNAITQINQEVNLPMEVARNVGFVPLRRGFAKPTYGLVGVTTALSSEDEVASVLASPDERFRQYEVSKYIEKIADRRVHTQAQVGTSTFTIDSIPGTARGVPVSIVNEGFGINQLLYMLTISLYSPFKIVAIEEPEIHLHPSMVRRLASVLAEIALNEGRRLIVSTHRETFVVALLTQIAAGAISVDDVSFILAENVEGETRLTRCEATPDGQIEGGLEPFMASELEDLAVFLGLSPQEA